MKAPAGLAGDGASHAPALETYIVTGATQGLGLATARALAARPSHHVVLAVRDIERGRSAASIGPNVTALRLDLSSLGDIRRFVAGWSGTVAGLVNNAGVQITNGTRLTRDGYEETFAVNYLGAVALALGLLPHLAGGRVLFIGSGTHDPGNRMAALFGFRGAQFTSIEAAARGEVADTASHRQAGLDRYATSKFLATVAAVELARRYPPANTAFFALDPGLMPGTGLARTAPALAQVAWKSVLRWAAPLLADTSNPQRSGATAAWLMTADGLAARSGAVVAHDRGPARRVWQRVFDPDVGRQLMDETIAMCTSGQTM